MPLKFTAPEAASAAPAATRECPPWLRPALQPKAAESATEWEAAIDGLTLFLIGDASYEGLFHKQLFKDPDHFGSMPANVAVIMQAIAADSLLDPEDPLRFRPSGLSDADLSALPEKDRKGAARAAFVNAPIARAAAA